VSVLSLGTCRSKNEVHSSNATDRMRHNIRGVKLTPASQRRYKIGLPVEGLNHIKICFSCCVY